MTPEMAFEKLRCGNEEYLACGAQSLPADAALRTSLVSGQAPYACIVCCSDSRVPPEIIFHAGLGELFVIRTAGNVIGPHECGSIEYAVTHLHIPLVVVMGHTHCGAGDAALNGEADGHIRPILEAIRTAADGNPDPQHTACRNAHAQMQALCADPALTALINSGSLAVSSALYDIETGAVIFH